MRNGPFGRRRDRQRTPTGNDAGLIKELMGEVGTGIREERGEGGKYSRSLILANNEVSR
jgi:hypothetical protein